MTSSGRPDPSSASIRVRTRTIARVSTGLGSIATSARSRRRSYCFSVVPLTRTRGRLRAAIRPAAAATSRPCPVLGTRTAIRQSAAQTRPANAGAPSQTSSALIQWWPCGRRSASASRTVQRGNRARSQSSASSASPVAVAGSGAPNAIRARPAPPGSSPATGRPDAPSDACHASSPARPTASLATASRAKVSRQRWRGSATATGGTGTDSAPPAEAPEGSVTSASLPERWRSG